MIYNEYLHQPSLQQKSPSIIDFKSSLYTYNFNHHHHSILPLVSTIIQLLTTIKLLPSTSTSIITNS